MNNLSKRQQSEIIFSQNSTKSRKEVIGLFMEQIGMSMAGASTYYANCKNGWNNTNYRTSSTKNQQKTKQFDLFQKIDQIDQKDQNDEIDQEVVVYTLVTLNSKDEVKECTASYMDLQQAEKDCKFDQIIVDKLCDVGDHKSKLSIVF